MAQTASVVLPVVAAVVEPQVIPHAAVVLASAAQLHASVVPILLVRLVVALTAVVRGLVQLRMLLEDVAVVMYKKALFLADRTFAVMSFRDVSIFLCYSVFYNVYSVWFLNLADPLHCDQCVLFLSYSILSVIS